jgi:hypothetical protein
MAEGQALSNINYSLQDYSTSIEYFDKVDFDEFHQSISNSILLEIENCQRMQ